MGILTKKQLLAKLMELKSEMGDVKRENTRLSKDVSDLRTICKHSKLSKQVKISRFEAENALTAADEMDRTGNSLTKKDGKVKRRAPTFIARKVVPKPKALPHSSLKKNYTLLSRHYLATVRKSIEKRHLMHGILSGVEGGVSVGVDRVTIVRDARMRTDDGKLENCMCAVIETHAPVPWDTVQELVNRAAGEDVGSDLCTCELIIDFNGRFTNAISSS
jgi:hypothetical protein